MSKRNKKVKMEVCQQVVKSIKHTLEEVMLNTYHIFAVLRTCIPVHKTWYLDATPRKGYQNVLFEILSKYVVPQPFFSFHPLLKGWIM